MAVSVCILIGTLFKSRAWSGIERIFMDRLKTEKKETNIQTNLIRKKMSNINTCTYIVHIKKKNSH